MIKKLRRRFIGISLLSMFLVLFLILGITNLVSVNHFETRTNEILNVLGENNGYFPETNDPIAEEELQATRYFTVTLNESGVLLVDTTNIVRVTSDEAIEIALEQYENKIREGSVESFAFRGFENEAGNWLYVFLDIQKSVDTLTTLFTNSLIIGVSGTILFFLVLYLFSRIAFKPVAESYQKQRLFITNASHELKTPLAVISANNEIIEMEHGEDEWTKSTKKQIAGMNELIRRLITLSKIDEERKADFRTVNVSDVLLNLKNQFKSLEVVMNKPLQVHIEDNLTIKGNETELTELFSVLIENAIKYANENEPIKIELTRKKKFIVFTLVNGSQNFEAGNANFLFERFYRSDNDSNKSGFGIGLSIAKAIVENHHGKINAECIEGKEIKFTVMLPYTK